MNIQKMRLKELVSDSEIAEVEKWLWYNFIPLLSGDDTQSILAILEKNPEDLRLLTDNVKAKINTPKNDVGGWIKITKTENDILENI